MKKIIFLLLVFMWGTSLVPASFAENMKVMMQEGDAQGQDRMGKGMMGGKGMGMMGHMMMKSMMHKEVVATSDGGVVVVAGNAITKYDKNLKVVGEAQIKMNMESMQKDMMEIMKNCPMMKGGVSDKESAQPAETGKEVDHEAHH